MTYTDPFPSTNTFADKMMTRLFSIVCGLLAVLVALPSWAQSSAEPRVAMGGRVSLTFRNIPSEDAGTVNGEYVASLSDGTIALPYLSGRVRVAGKTARQVEDMVSTLYKEQKIYTNPIVAARVDVSDEEERSRRYIQVTGYVGGKKNLPYRPGITLIQALLDCGDITDYGSRHIQVTRKNVTRTYDYYSARDRSIRLLPDDVIYVPERGAFEPRPKTIGP